MGGRRLSVALIGAGPTASSLLERLLANAPELLPDRDVAIHLVDPHRAGTGRVWRADNHAGLWMNSMAEDVTMFTDASVACEGPIRPGPSLFEWAHDVDDATLSELASPELVDEIRSLGPMTFPTRRVQSVYLDWFHRRALDARPDGVDVVVHRCRAIDVVDASGGARQRILLDDGTRLDADVVVLALGHLDSSPDPGTAAFSAFADRHGLVHIPPAHTAELDLSAVLPGEAVIANGFGQAFTDLVVLLTEGRGGRFVDDAGTLRYEPSGREPVLHVGSRRGVPYRSKLDYRLQHTPAPFPRFLDDAGIAALAAQAPLDFRRDVLPVVRREVQWSWYHELAHAHPGRATVGWDRLADAIVHLDADALEAFLAEVVPDPEDRFDIAALDRPLAGLTFGSADALHRHVFGHIARDVGRRTDPANSADLAGFNALLWSMPLVGRLAASLSPRSRVEDTAWWFSFFMYYASGPPPQRLRQLLALADAGVVRFLGADTSVRADEDRGRFVATSASHPDSIGARVLIEARVAGASVSRTQDELLRRLASRGEVAEEVVTDGDWSCNTGKVVVELPALRTVDRHGRPHPARHALGTFTNRPAAGAFARPRTNAPSFRQNDAVARSILGRLATIAATTVPEEGAA